MMKQSLAAPILSAAFLAAGPPASAEGADFNGTWIVQLVTEAGVCGSSSYSYTVAIQDGQVRLVPAGGSASITGRIGPGGSVGLVIQQGPASGTASGRLRSSSGSGTWKVSAVCSGRWAAQRGSTIAAQAF
jgi:hypothetical protein